MLISLLRHGSSTSLKTRVIRNCSATTTSCGYRTSARREEGTNGSTTAIDADIKEGIGLDSLLNSEEARSRHVKESSVPNAGEEKWRTRGDGTKSNIGYGDQTRFPQNDMTPGRQNGRNIGWIKHLPEAARAKVLISVKSSSRSLQLSIKKPKRRLNYDSGRQNERNTGWINHLPKAVRAKVLISIKTGTTSSQLSTRKTKSRPNYDSKPTTWKPKGFSTHDRSGVTKRIDRDPPFLYKLDRENSIFGRVAALGEPGHGALQRIGADLSLYDGPGEKIQKDGFNASRTKGDVDQSTLVSRKLATLQQFMTVGNPRSLLIFMKRECEDTAFMRAIPGLVFVELLRQLEPEEDFLPLRSDYKELGPQHYGILMAWRSKITQTLHDRRQFYHDIVTKRVESGALLELAEYTQILNLARSTWDGVMASDIMKEMISNGVNPNLSCYNHYFEARCWSDAYHTDECHRLRVVPQYIEMRKKDPRRSVPGSVMVDGHRVDENGLRWEISRMFTKMVNEGIDPDTRAYCNLIIAHSREGDLHAVKSVLLRFWHVDVDALLAGKPDYSQQDLQRDSPTYPTEDLLYTVAHAFGSNSDIPAAMQIVAHLSSKFEIAISQAVWSELLEWTYVLSHPRRKERLVDGRAKGQLPLRSVESLFKVMLSPPYNGEPTLRMYDYVIRSFWRRPLNHRTLHDCLDMMRKGAKFHDQAFGAFAESRDRLVNMLRDSEAVDPISLDTQQSEVAKAWSDRWFSFVLGKKWLDLLLSCPRWLRNEEERERIWTRKMLPDAIKEFWRFKSNQPLTYLTATGRVELDEPVEKEQSALRKSRFSFEMDDWGSGWATWNKPGNYVEDPEANIGRLEADMESSETDLDPPERENAGEPI